MALTQKAINNIGFSPSYCLNTQHLSGIITADFAFYLNA
jgi:hypothetical protein